MECNAWTWCADVDTCLDEHLRRIPYRGCQLKTETQQPAGLPSDEYVRKFRPSTLASGYVKRASQLPRPPPRPPKACLGTRSWGTNTVTSEWTDLYVKRPYMPWESRGTHADAV